MNKPDFDHTRIQRVENTWLRILEERVGAAIGLVPRYAVIIHGTDPEGEEPDDGNFLVITRGQSIEDAEYIAWSLASIVNDIVQHEIATGIAALVESHDDEQA